MALYRLVLDPTFTRHHVVFTAKDAKWTEKLGGKSVAKRYKPLKATLFELTRGKPGDLHLVVGTPIVTAKAWTALEPLLGEHVEALPIALPKEKRFILNVLARSDGALDEAACRGNRIALHASELPSAPIFGVGRAAHVETLVRETVKDLVIEAKLTGWAFETATAS